MPTTSLREPNGAPALVPDGSVRFADVSFSYTSGVNLIKNLNLDVLPGRRVAIVGPTGCGKTTLINLLMRFYDVNSGAILVAGRDIRAVTRASLRRGFGNGAAGHLADARYRPREHRLRRPRCDRRGRSEPPRPPHAPTVSSAAFLTDMIPCWVRTAAG